MGMARRTLMLCLVLAFGLAGGGARALDLDLPDGAVPTREEASPADTYQVPVGPFDGNEVPTQEVAGRVTRQAWRIESDSLTTLDILTSLREQLVTRGYEMILDCASRECGGFDFRFNIDLLPAPDLFVDLFDYRFLSARLGAGASADYVSVLVSRSGGAAYVQLTAAGARGDPGGNAAPATEAATPRPPAAETAEGGSLAARLQGQGHVILRDLEFASGAETLAERDYASLAALADFLDSDENRRVVLVGHTDAVGSLSDNRALSRRRAAAVRQRLIESHGVSPDQLEAEGVGYLAPVAPNTTPERREANRRVEAVLLRAP